MMTRSERNTTLDKIDPEPGLLVPSGRITVVMPFFDDAPACEKLLRRLDEVMNGITFDVLVVNDGSATPVSIGDAPTTFHSIRHIDELRLRRNMGHQRAIAVGLAQLESIGTGGVVVVMDSDGEDDPQDVPRLLDEYTRAGCREIVFAERVRRTEGPAFRTLYWCYRKMHHALTGHRVRVGNFSVLPAAALRGLVVVPELWNHFAAAIFVSRMRYRSVPCPRGRRFAGKSKMNLVSLVMHGLSGMSVFSDVVSVRILIATTLVVFAMGAGLLTMVVARLASRVPNALPVNLISMLFALVAASIMFLLILTFLVLAQRKNASTLPARDFAFYVDRVDRLYPGVTAGQPAQPPQLATTA